MYFFTENSNQVLIKLQAPSKVKQSYSLPRDYPALNGDRLFVQKKNLSNCEIITTVSNEPEDIYLDNDEINELKNGLRESELFFDYQILMKNSMNFK